MKRLADGGERVVLIPVVLERVQVEVAVVAVAVDVGRVAVPHRAAVYIQKSVLITAH